MSDPSTLPRRVDHLLVGGGIACVTAAQTLREQGAGGSVAIVSRELDLPYHRPPCSKGYLQGSESREDAWLHPADWYEEQGVDLLTRTSVLSLDLEARTAKLSTKEEIAFDSLLVATGAMVRRLAVEGSQLEGIHYLRALGNADAIRRDAEQAERVVLIGGSYIACEVAATLTTLGHACTMVMVEDVVLERGFGAQAGRFFQDALETHGVTVIAADQVARLQGSGERLTHVITESGRELPADLVVAGVGAQPDVMLARKAGLEIGDLGGVRVNANLQADVPGVFAAGDMAEYYSVVHGRVMRIEHEDVAASQGHTVALNMLGREQPHDVVPYFFSDLADWASLEYVGPAAEWDEEIVRGSLETGEFSHWYLLDGRVVAALAVGRSSDLDHARRLIAEGSRLDDERARLADPDSELAVIGR
jgi:3-phenylpropionate/trans-cinnamate dioxygenase ferredoxin reductase subunit